MSVWMTSEAAAAGPTHYFSHVQCRQVKAVAGNFWVQLVLVGKGKVPIQQISTARNKPQCQYVHHSLKSILCKCL